LPKTLDDTYCRILRSIDEEYSQDVIKALHWLAQSARPLRLKELAEVVAIDIADKPHFDPGNRLREPEDILFICSSLVSVSSIKYNEISSDDDDDSANSHSLRREVRLAHFSVKEYLISTRIRTGPASKYSIKSFADNYIARACLCYLLYFKGDKMLNRQNFKHYPLAYYASRFWWEHALKSSSNTDEVERLALDLFADEGSYLNWARIVDLDKAIPGSSSSIDLYRKLEDIASPLYYSSLAGLANIATRLVELGADVNAQGGRLGNILNAASFSGHVAIVEMLLEKGINAKFKDEEWGDALAVASLFGKRAVVKLLLERGFDVNAQSGSHGTALLAASYRGNSDIVQVLLEAGANVDSQVGTYGTALKSACRGLKEKVVQQLLNAGADVNARCGMYGSALQAAVCFGVENVVKRFLDADADVNAQGGNYGNALQAAAFTGSESIVQMFLDADADVNAQGGNYGNALQAAAFRGSESIVQMLLDAGADVNAQGGSCGNAITAAKAGKSQALCWALGGGIVKFDKIIQLLLDAGAKSSDEQT
jgi:ankyrin repeat protein